MIRNRFDGFVSENPLVDLVNQNAALTRSKRNQATSIADGWHANVSLHFGPIFDTKITALERAVIEVSRGSEGLVGVDMQAWVSVAGMTIESLLAPTSLDTSAKAVSPNSASDKAAESNPAIRTAAVVKSTFNTGDGSQFEILANLIGGDVHRLATTIRGMQLNQIERRTFQAVVPEVEDEENFASRETSSDGDSSHLFFGNGGGGSGGTNNFPPRVTLTSREVEVGRSFAVSDIFQYSDIEGNPMTSLRIIDRSPDGESGYVWFRGQRVVSNLWFEVAADQVQYLRFFAGLVPIRDNIGMMVSDGMFWSSSAFIDIHTIRPNLFPPVAEGFDGQVLAFESVKIANFIRATDPENDLRTVRFIDRQNNPNSGYFSINGVAQTQGQWFEVSVNDIDSINYHGGQNGQAEFVAFQVYDGRFWSNVANFRMQTNPNIYRPVVAAPDLELLSGQVIQVANWVTFTDADGNTPKRYRFYDTGNRSEGGYFTVDGQVQAANSWFQVEANDLHSVRYHASEFADFEKFRVMAFDGRYWSDIATGSVTVRVKPITDLPDLIVASELQAILLRDLVSVDGNGLSVKNVQIFAPNGPAGGPQLRLGDTVLQNGRFHEISWQQFQNVSYVGGSGGSNVGRYLSDLSLRFDNGVAWSAWERIDTITEIVGSRALRFRSWGDFPGQDVEVTYSFPFVIPFYYPGDSFPYDGETAPFNAEQRQRVRDAFEIISSFSNITFREVPDTVGGMMRFMFAESDAWFGRVADFPSNLRSNASQEGDVWMNMVYYLNSEFLPGSHAWMVLLHEIGHGLGMKHSFQAPTLLPTATDNQLYTMMAYRQAGDIPGIRNGNTPALDELANPEIPNGYNIDTPMFYDILEIQRLYGASEFQNHDDTVYSWANQPFRETIRDTGGFDTIDASNFSTDQVIDLRPGRLSDIGENAGSVFLTYDSRIENAIGGRGNDRLIGNELSNVLVGGLGNDILEGRGGTNLLMGGAGNDTYVWRWGDAWSVIDEDRSAGRDEIHVFGNHSVLNAPFGTINELENDILFRRLGRDLRIDFTIDQGEAIGGFTVRDQAWGGSRVETLRIFGLNGQQIGGAVNLDSIFSQATDVGQYFRLTDIDTPLGFIAVPV